MYPVLNSTTAPSSLSSTVVTTANANFPYVGNYIQQWSAPVNGLYRLQAWGAEGGGTSSVLGGSGAYVTGNIQLPKNQMLYIAVGSKGGANMSSETAAFNNGAIPSAGSSEKYNGGGSTDFRLNSGNGIWYDNNSLQSRIMVAGAGGGAEIYYTQIPGGAAGAFVGYPSGNGSLSTTATATTHNCLGNNYTYYKPTTGGTQNSGGQNGMGYYWSYDSDMLKGGFGRVIHSANASARGGNGYYSGGSGAHTCGIVDAGDGGSSYVSGYSDSRGSCRTLTDSKLGNITFTSANMIDGKGAMTSPTGAAETGHAGDGYARITLISTNFTIINHVSGTKGDPNLNFSYTLSGLTANASYFYIRYTSSNGSTWTQQSSGSLTSTAAGTTTFNLKHNEKIVITIPAGTTISISENTEHDYEIDNSINSGNSTGSVSVNTTDTVTFVNIYNIIDLDVTIRKVWDDNNNIDGYREQACVQLQYGGQPTCYQYTFPGNSTTEQFTFTDLPASQDWAATETGSSCAGGLLPSDYVQLDWIKSSGGSYIDTEYYPSNNTRVLTTLKDLPHAGAGNLYFGARVAINDSAFTFFDPSDTNGYRDDFGTSQHVLSSISMQGKFTIDKNKNTTTIYDDDNTYIHANPDTVFSTPYSLFIFSFNNGGIPHATGEISSVTLYSFKIWDNDILVRDFIPCYRISDGAAGLYDTVNGVFYTNQGTGEFIKGPAVGWSGVECPGVLYLIKDGQPVNNEITGGWQSRGWKSWSAHDRVAPTVIYNSNNIAISQTGTNSARIPQGLFEVASDIDFSQYTRIYVDYSAYLECSGDSNTAPSISFQIMDRNVENYNTLDLPSGIKLRGFLTDICILNQSSIISKSRTTENWTVSDITGLYSLAINDIVVGYGYSSIVTIYNIWLEK